MKIIAVDTSTISGGVALLDGRRVAAEWTLDTVGTHNRKLLESIHRLLTGIGLRIGDIDGFAVAVGPGSFTGLRIGVTTVKTLAWTLHKPYAAVPTLDALAAPFGFASVPVLSILDARKKEVFCALYRPDGKGNVRRESPWQVLPPERAAELVRELTIVCGDGLEAYGDLLRESLGDRLLMPPVPFHSVRAAFVGHLALDRFLAGEADDPVTSVPLYVRASEAEIKRSS